MIATTMDDYDSAVISNFFAFSLLFPVFVILWECCFNHYRRRPNKELDSVERGDLRRNNNYNIPDIVFDLEGNTHLNDTFDDDTDSSDAEVCILPPGLTKATILSEAISQQENANNQQESPETESNLDRDERILEEELSHKAFPREESTPEATNRNTSPREDSTSFDHSRMESNHGTLPREEITPINEESQEESIYDPSSPCIVEEREETRHDTIPMERTTSTNHSQIEKSISFASNQGTSPREQPTSNTEQSQTESKHGSPSREESTSLSHSQDEQPQGESIHGTSPQEESTSFSQPQLSEQDTRPKEESTSVNQSQGEPSITSGRSQGEATSLIQSQEETGQGFSPRDVLDSSRIDRSNPENTNCSASACISPIVTVAKTRGPDITTHRLQSQRSRTNSPIRIAKKIYPLFMDYMSELESYCETWTQFKENEAPPKNACESIDSFLEQYNKFRSSIEVKSFRHFLEKCIEDKDNFSSSVSSTYLYECWYKVHLEYRIIKGNFNSLNYLRRPSRPEKKKPGQISADSSLLRDTESWSGKKKVKSPESDRSKILQPFSQQGSNQNTTTLNGSKDEKQKRKDENNKLQDEKQKRQIEKEKL